MKDQIPITEIKITARQRTKIEIDDEFVASVNRRLINPIVLRETPEGIELVAGQRRLEALKRGEITDLMQNIHFRDFSDLDPIEAKIIELEENLRREDLPWRDQVNAIADLHTLIQPSTTEQTALRVGFHKRYVQTILMIHKNLNSPVLAHADGISQAYSILQVQAERKVAEIVGNLGQHNIFQPKEPEKPNDPTNSPDSDISRRGSGNNSPADIPIPIPVAAGLPSNGHQSNTDHISVNPSPAIINTDFIQWASNYTGPKFNLIHCDFPYDIDYTKYAQSTTSGTDYDFKGFWTLTEALLTNLDRLCSYSTHMVFWFSMEYYEKTRTTLESAGLYVHRHPLIWHKTDNAGIVPGRDNQFPRRIYETAFLCSRGKRPLVKIKANTYGAPMADRAIHPSQKPEPMLNFFFEMLVDETTDFFDPTCGSGSSIRSAENCGARSVLGLELNPDYASAAEAQTQSARKLRNLKL